MMRKVEIVDSGDTYFLEKQLVSKTICRTWNLKLSLQFRFYGLEFSPDGTRLYASTWSHF